MSAREDFLRRIRAVREAVTAPNGLKVLQHQPADPGLDEAARLFRNGLAVTAFAVLEDFLKSRTAEILDRCSGCPLAFDDLPNGLQELSTKQVVTALRFQMEMRSRSGEDVSGLIRSTGKALASTDTSTYELSRLAFGQSRSNLSPADIKELLKAFRVLDGWENATKFAQRMGFASLSLRDDFQAAARRRHQAAHRGGEEVPLGDLQSLPTQALAVAASFDATLSRAAYRLLRGDIQFAQSGALDSSDIPLRFLHSDGNVVREMGEKNRRATVKGETFDQLLPSCRKRASVNGAVIVLTENRNPRGWEITDLEQGRP